MEGVDRRTALKVARRIGCDGVHEAGDGWMPCRTAEELVAVSRAAETGEKSARRRRRRRVSSRRGDGWERLREMPLTAIVSSDAGLSSGLPGDEITASGPTGSTGTPVSGGVMGGAVDGSFGSRYAPDGSFASVKKLPKDADRDGWIDEGTPKKRFIGIQAAAEAVDKVRGRLSPSKRQDRKPGSRVAVEVADAAVPEGGERRRQGRELARRAEQTVRSLSDSPETYVEVSAAPDTTKRYGRPPRKPEQELTDEGRELRRANWQRFPRAVKPKGNKPGVTVAEMRAKGTKTTAEYFGLDTTNRTLDHPGVPEERRQVYDSIARAMVYGDPENPIDLPVSEQPTLHLMGGGPASGKSYLRQAGFFDIPDRSQAAHIDIDEGRKMLPEYDDMLREMGDSVTATEELAGLNHFEATHVGRVATDMAFKGRHDVVLDSTGDGGPYAFAARLQQAREAGYKIKAHFATASLGKAVNSARERAKAEKRGVDPKELIDNHVDVSRAVLFGLKEGLFDELTLVDNEDWDNPVVFAEYKAGLLTIHNIAMWDEFVKKAVAAPIRYPNDYFSNFPEDLVPKLEGLRAKAVTMPKLRGKNAERLKEQSEGMIVVLSPDKETVWYEVTAEGATDDDFRKMLEKAPPADFMPMAINDSALYRIRSGRILPHVPDLPPDTRLPAMTRREIRVAVLAGQTLREAGIADTPEHQKEWDEIAESVKAMKAEGVRVDLQAHLVEAIPEGFSKNEKDAVPSVGQKSLTGYRRQALVGSSFKKRPLDADADGWIDEGKPTERFVGVDAAVEAVGDLARGATETVSSSRGRERKPDSRRSVPAPDADDGEPAAPAALPKPKKKKPTSYAPNSVGGMGFVSLKDSVGTIADPVLPERAVPDVVPDPPSVPASKGTVRAERTAEQILERNEEIKGMVAESGGSLFSVPDRETADRLEEETKAVFGNVHFPVSDTETMSELLRGTIAETAKSVKASLESGSEEYAGLHPEVKKMILELSPEEIVKVVEEQAVKFHETVDRRPRVRIGGGALRYVVRDGRYKTTHEVKSSQSGSKARRAYEIRAGYPPSAPAESRPASGYMNHPDWDGARTNAYKGRWGEEPGEFEYLAGEGDNEVAIYGRTEIILRPEVAGRTGFGNGDSLNTGMYPAPMDGASRGQVLKAQLSADKKQSGKNLPLILGFLKSRATGSFVDLGSRWDTETESMDSASRAADTQRLYQEALIAGSFDLGDIEEVRIPYDDLAAAYDPSDPEFYTRTTRSGPGTGKDEPEMFFFDLDEKKSREAAEQVKEEFLSPEVLGEMGFSDDEIKMLLGAVGTWQEEGAQRRGYDTSEGRPVFMGMDSKNPIWLPQEIIGALASGDGSSGIMGLLRFRRAKAQLAEMESKGLKTTVLVSRGSDLPLGVRDRGRTQGLPLDDRLEATLKKQAMESLKRNIRDVLDRMQPKQSGQPKAPAGDDDGMIG